MNVVRQFSWCIERWWILLIGSAIAFVTAFTLMSWYNVHYIAAGAECLASFRLYEINPDKSWVVARGDYRINSNSGIEGKNSYIGKISYMDPNDNLKKQVAVSREVDWKMTVRDKRIVSEITATNRRIGDHSSDREVGELIFPVNSVGQVFNIGLFLINEKVIASGPGPVPRIICK